MNVVVYHECSCIHQQGTLLGHIGGVPYYVEISDWKEQKEEWINKSKKPSANAGIKIKLKFEVHLEDREVAPYICFKRQDYILILTHTSQKP